MAGVKTKSGGVRSNTRLKAKTADPQVLATWQSNLKRAICIASSNMFVLPKTSFYTTREIKATFGKRALEDFKKWFDASKHFDQHIADKLYQEKASNKISEEKFTRLFYSTAFFWVWTVKSEKQKDAWAINRGTKELSL